jgi:hypothetical protein
MANHLRVLRGGKVSFFLFMDTITAVTAMLIMVSLMMTLYLGGTPESAGNRANVPPERLAGTLVEVGQITAQNQSLRALLASANVAPDAERLRADLAMLRSQITNQSQTLAELDASQRQYQTNQHDQEFSVVLAEQRLTLTEIMPALQAVRLSNQLAQAAIREAETNLALVQTNLLRIQGEDSLWLIPEADSSGKTPLLVIVSRTNLVCQRFNQAGSRQEFIAGTGEQQFAAFLRQLNPARDYLVFYIRPSGISVFTRCRQLAKQAGLEVGYDAVEEDRRIQFTQMQTP